LDKNGKNTKNCQYLRIGWKYRKILKISTFAPFLGVLQGMINGLKLYRKKYFWINIERYFLRYEFRQQVWGLGISPYRCLAVPKISRKSGADRS